MSNAQSAPNKFKEFVTVPELIQGEITINKNIEKAVSEEKTKVRAIIHKPMQLFDPVGICYRVFRKLEKSIEKNMSQSDE